MDEAKRDHLDWAIRSRARNQACSLSLLVLFTDHAKTWKTKTHANAAQDLAGLAFSLWRAAFLAQRTGKRSEVFAHAKDFLERVIEDNAISYLHDKNAREWTFNYYTRNARASLQSLHKAWPDVVPVYVAKTRTPTERWDYCQDLFEEAVAGFQAYMTRPKPKPKPSRKVRRPGDKSKHEKRALVRKMVLAAR